MVCEIGACIVISIIINYCIKTRWIKKQRKYGSGKGLHGRTGIFTLIIGRQLQA